MKYDHTIFLSLKYLGGCILVVGLIYGLISGQSDDGFIFSNMLLWWFGSITSGMLLIGLSEIVKLLNESNKEKQQPN
ncbi:hypothetical protein EBB07_29415 [Paenibacillaceae bacterium]|nr:hypothetical protein EBB07_29415 [Paenibacillaceae bacterium]